jgi:hypothetical protein
MTSILKLSNGLEVVGTIEVENDYNVVVNKPLQINYRYFQGSIPSVSFVRYIMFARSDVVGFCTRDIMSIVDARESFALYYANVVDQYYGDLEKVIDKELENITITPTEKGFHESILESMSVEGATIN